ncbi:ureidoglycolate lyase [Hoeflea prorocentri]|uniref:Ureidoglycolate lyase n=1 Tax=Hoeflea prorocentri TaxID=1922333 RepID=A0A9X3UMY6_9HYPH|nr:ureidoglycolate lyase [Hoeflea prorocentri]MCY6382026.1 ureidoglycolate lyase [Hoeflea prorocentri]MDA5399826.1 ureidoglycolate lyase [Hoeflea prorocentri]
MADVLPIGPLTRAAFAPFGEVLETDGAERRIINEGTTERFHALACAEAERGGKVIINLFRGQPRPFPYEIAMMERHPLGSQAFFPIDNRPWLVVVAKDEDGRPGLPQAFLAGGRQGVNFHANVWHHPLIAIDEVSDFLVVDREGEGDNLEEADYPSVFRIERDNW